MEVFSCCKPATLFGGVTFVVLSLHGLTSLPAAGRPLADLTLPCYAFHCLPASGGIITSNSTGCIIGPLHLFVRRSYLDIVFIVNLFPRGAGTEMTVSKCILIRTIIII